MDADGVDNEVNWRRAVRTVHLQRPVGRAIPSVDAMIEGLRLRRPLLCCFSQQAAMLRHFHTTNKYGTENVRLFSIRQRAAGRRSSVWGKQVLRRHDSANGILFES